MLSYVSDVNINKEDLKLLHTLISV